MSIHPITYNPVFLSGQTLDTNFEPAQPPFDITSLPKLFDQDEFIQIPLTSGGLQKGIFQLTMDSKSKVTALGVDGSLDLTCGPVTGDANVKFAMDNINSGLTLSIIYRATRSGQLRRVDLFDLNTLKLSDSVITKIKNGLTLPKFKQSYGSYIIIGFESGGQIVYDCTYETKDSQDKTAVSGGLSLAYNKVPGFSVSGSVNGNYDKTDISKSLNVKTTYSINPSTDSDDQINLLKYLNELTNISQITDSKSSDLVNLKYNIDKVTTSILNPSTSQNNEDERKLNWTKAIIYPIDSIPCVANEYAEEAIEAVSISGFLSFLNDLYIDIKSKVADLETMTNKWSNPPDIFETYAVKLSKIMQLIETLNNYDSLSKYGSDGYNKYIRGSDDNDDSKEDLKEDEENDDNKQQIDIDVQDFYKISIILLNSQYIADILTPYNNYITTLAATLTVLCNDIVTVHLSQDGGNSFDVILDKYVGWKSQNEWEAKQLSIQSITKDTVLTFDCQNNEGGASFIATIDYNNNKYSTPGHFTCTTSDAGTSFYAPLYYWGAFVFGEESNPNIIGLETFAEEGAMQIWPNMNRISGDKQTFKFKFSDIIN